MSSPSDTSDAPLLRASGSAPAPPPALPLLQRASLLPRVSGSLLLANVRYWHTVAPLVERELARWRRRAAAIDEPQLRALALAKLDGERFNAEAGAMLATFAPPARRADVVAAIVALQLLFDLLDGLTERPSEDPLADGQRLFAAFTDALRSPEQITGASRLADEGYLDELSRAVRDAVARLPAWGIVSELAAASAQRAAEAQIRMHATPLLGTAQLMRWAQAEASGTGLQWRELSAAAASSVLVVHALIATAADAAASSAQAAEIARAYLYICALLTLLDSLTDGEADALAGERGYVSLYDDPQQLAQLLAALSGRALFQLRELRRPARHVMILTGVVAYYASAPGARAALARPSVTALHRGLWPLVSPALLVMRCWRLARRLRGRR